MTIKSIIVFCTSNVTSHLSKGNQLALRWLYDEYAEGLYQLAMQILKEEQHAEEMVQDSFVQLWNRRESLDENSNLKALLFVICRNNSFNRFKVNQRHRSRFVELEDSKLASSWGHEEDPLAERDLKDLIEKVIRKLPLKQQLVFRLSRLEGLSHQEIADRLQISKNTVKNHLIAALKAVKEELQEVRTQSSIYALLYFYLFL